eukprot:TRINITY_DN874_c0_g1_i1.p1 TRINITY_DN874_c0_g1~~TRINITY_DN874_c0_g1_i1.p1  ORF type:complete len:372 (+),score=62.54 TRINITY_DN874_c0_g1_i1:786-1901(+)
MRRFKKLNRTTTHAREELFSIQETIKQTEHSSMKCRAAIEASFCHMREVLKERENQLLQTLEEQTSVKTQILEKQAMDISETLSTCALVKRNSTKILGESDFEGIFEREGQIKKSIGDISEVKLNAPVLNPEIMCAMDISSVIKAISSFGRVMSGAILTPPIITEVRPSYDFVQVHWGPRDLQEGFGGPLQNVEFLQYGLLISRTSEGEPPWSTDVICDAKQDNFTFSNLKRDCQYEIQVRGMDAMNESWGEYCEAKLVATLRGNVWNSNEIGPGLQITNGNELLCSGDERYWRIGLSDTVYTKGRHTFCVLVKETRNNQIMIGIAPRGTDTSHTNKHFYHHKNSCGFYCYNGSSYQDGKLVGKGESFETR